MLRRSVQIAVVVAAILLIVACRSSLYTVTGGSMLPTFGHGDLLIANRLSYVLSSPAYDDIVILRWSEDQVPDWLLPDAQQYASSVRVFRIVGLAGDTIEGIDGVLYRNGIQLEESFSIPERFAYDLETVLIPDGHVYLLGDNRADAIDSRELGPVDRRNIVGRVQSVIRL